jgi:hypothetical protein
MRPRTRSMRFLIPVSVMVIIASGSDPKVGSLPLGRQHRLTIVGDFTVTPFPETGLAPLTLDYRAEMEYVVNTRRVDEAETKADIAAKKKSGSRNAGPTKRAERKKGDKPAAKVTGAVDIAIHSAELKLRRDAEIVLESRINRASFQGQLVPEDPFLNVSYREAPPGVQDFLRTFDTTAASVLLDDRSHVVARRIRNEGPLYAFIETLLSIHTPIPSDLASWEAPAQLAMGLSAPLKGILHFEKLKSDAKTDELVRVKVSGMLEAVREIRGSQSSRHPFMVTNVEMFNYKVVGEQTYNPRSREWRSARWLVDTLVHPDNRAIAEQRVKIIVESKALDDPPADAAAPIPKL